MHRIENSKDIQKSKQFQQHKWQVCQETVNHVNRQTQRKNNCGLQQEIFTGKSFNLMR